MHLSKYLQKRGSRTRFAQRTGMSAPAVTRLCNDDYWPSREVWKLIFGATDGQVTPNDHLNSGQLEQ